MRHHNLIAKSWPVLALIAALGTSPDVRAAYFLMLGDLPGGSIDSSARDVSDDGSVVVGVSLSPATEGFRWSLGTGMVGLGFLPGGDTSRALTVSRDGTTIGGWGSSTPGPQAFVSSGGGLLPQGDLPGGDFDSSFRAANGDGSVLVGSASNAAGSVAVRWTPLGGFAQLGHLPGGGAVGGANGVNADGSVIVGSSDSAAAGLEAFRWTALGGMQPLGGLPGWQISQAIETNAAGDVVVGISSGGGDSEAFLWTALGGMQGLGDLPGGDNNSTAKAVSDDGSIVVGTGRTILGDEAFLWTALTGMQRLEDVLAFDYGLDLTGLTLTDATAISGDGRYIVGEAVDANGNREAFLAFLGSDDPLDVSAPGALLLFTTALAGLAATRRPRAV
jgi:probable HAF family extracellular repeat protein